MSSSIIKKPSSGWIHDDSLISDKGATYAIRYIGCLEVHVSMKKLDFKTRSSVAKACISRVCEAARLKTADKRHRVDKKVLRAIVHEPNLEHAGANVQLTVSSARLTLTELHTGKVIASHDMPRISFVSGGDADTLDFVAYIAKDASEWRACYVLECGGGLAKDVISTIGQAFELRFQQYMKPSVYGIDCPSASSTSGCGASGGGGMRAADKEYYNDLPGKMPPEVGPPPVPPLPTVVPHPICTLPPVQSPNLIDLNAVTPPPATSSSSLFDGTYVVSHIASSPTLSSVHEYQNNSLLLGGGFSTNGAHAPKLPAQPHHDYVNDVCGKERDDFGMENRNSVTADNHCLSNMN